MVKALTVMVKAFLLEKKNLGDYKFRIWAIIIIKFGRLEFANLGD